MSVFSDDEVNNPPLGNPRLRETPDLISSLNEAWFHALGLCAADTALSEVFIPLMRNSYIGRAIYAVHLLKTGHGDQLASDIASFIMKEA